MCSAPGNLYLTAFGFEVLAGFGQEIDVQTAEAVTARLEAPEGTRVFVEIPRSIFQQSEGEVYTNIDRLPSESGSMLEITKALRAFKLEQAEIRRDMRAEHFELLRQRKASKPPVADGDQEEKEEIVSEKPDELEPKTE
ncbi:MAG: hypothetical protein [Microviridae sp.]|nr:MAG: hypothetical protein [Microviridae sp.]